MPVQTITLSESPVLVQQHILTAGLASEYAQHSISASILTYGATVTHLKVPDRRGEPQDVVLGFDHWGDYLVQAQPGALNPYFGATIGRTASRVAHATFDLPTNPSTSHIATNHHTLSISNGLDCHHGGPLGFDKQHWTTVHVDNATNTVKLQLISPHGQNGYPGRLVSTVSFQLTPAGELVLDYSAYLQEDSTHPEKRTLDLHSTLVSLTNHTYWNLDGVLNSLTNDTESEELAALGSYCSVKDHTLWLASADLVELGDTHPVPTGNILDLSADPSEEEGSHLLLFTSASCAGKRLRFGLDAIPGGFGYDHVYSLVPPATQVSAIGIQGYYPATPHVATLYSPRTGIQLDLMTSEPALVLYAAGY
ncbi:hypothetical protein BGZ82_001887, partial [Podila clonocystis]